MIKVMFAWRLRPDQDPQVSEERYWESHAPLARKAFEGQDGFVGLVYNRVRAHRVHDFNQREARDATPEFEAFVELWFESREQLERAMSQPVLAEMFADHPSFMEVDIPTSIRVYELEERPILGSGPNSVQARSGS